MKLNRFQLQRLRAALEYRGRVIPLGAVLKGGWKFYLVFLLVFAGGAGWLAIEGEHTMAAALLGFIVAVLWRDLTYARVSARFKPVADAVTDWKKVQELLDSAAET